MTNFEWMRARLEHKAGVHLVYTTPLRGVSYETMRRIALQDNFCELMDDRILMGYMRYMQRERATGVSKYSDIYRMLGCIDQYARTGNLEYLVDAANFLRLEFRRSQHPKKHYHPMDRDGLV